MPQARFCQDAQTENIGNIIINIFYKMIVIRVNNCASKGRIEGNINDNTYASYSGQPA